MRKPPVRLYQQNLFDIEPTSPENKPSQKEQDDWVFDIMDALDGAVLTYSLHWRDLIPPRLLKVLPLARMIALMKKERLATYAECAVYLYTRTHEAPMDHELVDIYTHVCCTVQESFFHEDYWDAVQAPRKLSDWLMSKLNDLRGRLYRRRREILKAELKAQTISKTQAPHDKPRRSAKPGKHTGRDQQSMF